MSACESRLQDEGHREFEALKKSYFDPPVHRAANAVDQSTQLKETLQFARMWSKVVYEYSRGQLTYMTDRLVALSGIAQIFQKESKDEYLAGHWRRSLIIGLAWYLDFEDDFEGDTRGRTKVYTAPSWPWASVEGKVIGARAFLLPDPLIQEVCTLVEYNISLKGTDTTGQVTSGYIRLRGPLEAVSVGPHLIQARDWPDHYSVWMDDQTLQGLQSKTLYLLILYNMIEPEQRNSGQRWTIGILLEPVPSSFGDFRQVGCMNIRNRVWESQDLETYSFPQPIPALSGIDFDVRYGYTVRVI